MLYDCDSAEYVHLLIKAEKNIEEEKKEAKREESMQEMMEPIDLNMTKSVNK